MGHAPLGLCEKLLGEYKELEMDNSLSEEWAPLPPDQGPPLPRSLGIFWPWAKKETAPAPVREYIPQEVPQAPTTVAPITVISQAAPPPAPGSTVVPVTVISQPSETTPIREAPVTVEKYYLYTDVIGEGRTIPPSGRSYNAGTTVEVTAVPATGWQFDHWEGDAFGTNRVTRVKMDTEMNVIAVFTQVSGVSLPEVPATTPTGPAAPTIEVPQFPVVGMFGSPSLSLPSQITKGETLAGGISFPTTWPASMPAPPTLPSYPVTLQAFLVGSEYQIASRGTSFQPGQTLSLPISYDTSTLPEGNYSVKAKLTDAQGTPFISGIIGSLKILAAALPEPELPTLPGGPYKLTVDADPPDGSKGYAYAEPSLPAYPRGTVVKLIAVARTTSNYLDHWEVNGQTRAGGPGNYSITLWPMAQDVAVKAFFK
jgi:hypothetical protein